MKCSSTATVVFPPAVSSGLDLSMGSRLDPLNISAVLPGDGFLHVDQTTGYFSADLWMWNITLRGLGQGYLNDVSGGGGGRGGGGGSSLYSCVPAGDHHEEQGPH